MARLLLEVRRWALVVSCAPLAMLAGCPQEKAAAPGKAPAQATAPAIASVPSSGSAGQAGHAVVSPVQSADAAAKAAERLIRRHAERASISAGLKPGKPAPARRARTAA